jgi:hypothetical protein
MNASARARLNLVFAEATGSALVLLAIALRQRTFEKQSREVEPVSAPGPRPDRFIRGIFNKQRPPTPSRLVESQH